MSGSTSDPFMDALTDPRITALLGMTKGFAQAAMPTRMPTPFGAVLGMGAGGLLEGAKEGQQLQMGGQQLQQAKIGNQRAGMLLDAYKQMYGGAGAPFGAPSMGAIPAGQGGGSGSGGASGYLTSPQQLKMLGDLAMATGQDRSAATLYGMPNTMAGGAGYSMGANGAAFPTPGGAADPRTAAALEAAKAGAGEAAKAPYQPPIKVDVPDGNGGTVERQIPVTQWAGQNGGKPGAVPADPFPGWSKKINTAESGNVPDATNPQSTASGGGQFLAGTWPTVIRATRPDIAAGHTDADLMPLRNNPELAASATEQYARMNGASLAQRGLPVNGTTVAMAHGFGPGGAATILSAKPDAPLVMLPGMAPVVAANPQYQNMTAGQVVQTFQQRMGDGAPAGGGYGGKVTLGPQQDAALKIQTARAMPYDLRPGGMHVDPVLGDEIKNPELREITKPDGTKAYVHINPASPMAPAGTPGTAAPVVMGGQNVGNAVPADVQQGRDELTKGLFGKDTDSYVAANNTQGWLNQINHAAEVINKAGSAYQTGPYADTRLHLMAGLNDAARTLGMSSPFDEKAISSAEELRKATTTAGFELSSHYEGHARQAAATIMNATSAVPGITNSPQGVTLVSNGINEGAQSAIDMHNYKMARFSGSDPYGIAPSAQGTRGGSGLESAETDFVKAFPASMYSDRAISTVHPVQITAADQAAAMKQMEKYLPGTIISLPNGRQSMVPPRPGAPPVPTYMHNYLGDANAP